MTLYGHPRSSNFMSFKKANMRLPISDQWQHRPYLAPFSHNTSVTDTLTDRRQPRHKLDHYLSTAG